MIAVIQRVSQGSVAVDAKTVGKINQGLVILLGVSRVDSTPDADYLAEKIVHLRIFEDEGGKMNHSLLDVNGQLLAVSQFTLLANTRKGRRPSFIEAAAPEQAIPLYEHFISRVEHFGIHVEKGKFGASMQVDIINDGPVTIVMDSSDRHQSRRG